MHSIVTSRTMKYFQNKQTWEGMKLFALFCSSARSWIDFNNQIKCSNLFNFLFLIMFSLLIKEIHYTQYFLRIDTLLKCSFTLLFYRQSVKQKTLKLVWKAQPLLEHLFSIPNPFKIANYCTGLHFHLPHIVCEHNQIILIYGVTLIYGSLHMDIWSVISFKHSRLNGLIRFKWYHGFYCLHGTHTKMYLLCY